MKSHIRTLAGKLPNETFIRAPDPLPWPFEWLTPLRNWYLYNVKGIVF